MQGLRLLPQMQSMVQLANRLRFKGVCDVFPLRGPRIGRATPMRDLVQCFALRQGGRRMRRLPLLWNTAEAAAIDSTAAATATALAATATADPRLAAAASSTAAATALHL